MKSLYLKLIGGALAAVVIGVFIASWLARGREIDRLVAWQDTVVHATTLATVEPDAKGKRKSLDPTQVPAAIAALKLTADNAASVLREIDTAAVQQALVSKRLDENLAAILDGQRRSSAGTLAKITELQNRKSTGNPEQDCAIMEADSNAAWNGWRN